MKIKLTVINSSPISVELFNKIMDIVKNAKCPNEVLSRTFYMYRGIKEIAQEDESVREYAVYFEGDRNYVEKGEYIFKEE